MVDSFPYFLKEILGSLKSLFWSSSDVCPGFQSQGGIPRLCASLPACDGSLRFTSSVTPGGRLKGSIAAKSFWSTLVGLEPRIECAAYSCIRYCLQFNLYFNRLDWNGFDHYVINSYQKIIMITISTEHCTPYPRAVSLSDIVIRTLPLTCDRTNPRKQYSKTAWTTFYQMKLSALFGIIVRFMIKWKFL